MSKITINGITYDPTAPGLAGVDYESYSKESTKSKYILIQTNQPLSKEMKIELSGLGTEILEYVPDDTYLCTYSDDKIEGIRSLNYVVWANIYSRGFKIPPALISGLKSIKPSDEITLEKAVTSLDTMSTELKEIDVIFHSNITPKDVQNIIADAVEINESEAIFTKRKLRIKIAEKKLRGIAGIDEVRHLEEVSTMKFHNDKARQILNLDTPQSNPALQYMGAGQIITIADTGFDKGSKTDVHEAFKGRIIQLYALGRTNNSNDPDGHGTHVAGSAAGNGNSAILGHSVRGTAPEAQLVIQSVLDSDGGLEGLPEDLNNLFRSPYDNEGSRIHSNSWGSILGDGRYDSNAREVDEFVWNNRDCIICFAAGNEGVDKNADGVIDLYSITPPGTAKNCITIGATENDRPNFQANYSRFGYLSEPISSDQLADNPDGMVAFSSRGPTIDRRIKPDLVAPGSFILSTRSRATTSDGWGLSADPLYHYDGGTSMATPLVAGCAALVREFLANVHNILNPSAALVKAILINGAQPVSGQYTPSETGATPNFSSGFGRVDMASSLSQSIQVYDENAALDTGEEEKKIIEVSSGATLKVTLVWTDIPGPSLQNDLDLIIQTANGEERHGNKTPGSFDFDRVNNVEQIVWEDLPTGKVEIIVRAYRITSLNQPYALVIRTE
ncbi:MAG: S8 family serine peptidase [Bacteroidota bacterium]